MSAILDALRKAQEERKGTSPGAARKERGPAGGSKRKLYIPLLAAVALGVALWGGAGLFDKAPQAVSSAPLQAPQGMIARQGALAQAGVPGNENVIAPSSVSTSPTGREAVKFTTNETKEKVSKGPQVDAAPTVAAVATGRVSPAKTGAAGSSNRRSSAMTAVGSGEPVQEAAGENVRVAARRAAESDVAGLYNSALREGERGNLVEAKRLYLAVVSEKPAHMEALNNLGVLAMREGKPREGLFYFRKAIEVNPNYGKAYNNMGLIFLKEGDKGQAELYFRKAIDVGQEKAEPTLNLSALYRSERRLAEASQLLDNLLKRGEDNPLVHLSYAIVRDEMGNPGEAIAHYRKFLQSAGGTAGATAVRERLKNLETPNSVTVR